MFKEFVHDFGTVTKEERPVHKFEIKNIYKEDIRIQSVVSSCGCTTVSLTKNVLKTWETAEVVCRYNTHLFDNRKQATITVRFAEPFIGEVQLTVRGNIIQGMSVSSNEISFGEVTADQKPEQVVQISKNSRNFRIVDVTSTFPHISVGLRQTSRFNNRTSYEMVAKLKPSVPKGFQQGELVVIGRDGQQEVTSTIKFHAKVVSPLVLSPAILTLSPVRPGQEVIRKVVAKADQPFRILDVTSTSDSFRVRADTTQKRIHFIEVAYVGNDAEGRHEWELDFKTDLGGEADGKIRAIVDVIAEEDAQVSEIKSDGESDSDESG